MKIYEEANRHEALKWNSGELSRGGFRKVVGMIKYDVFSPLVPTGFPTLDLAQEEK